MLKKKLIAAVAAAAAVSAMLAGCGAQTGDSNEAPAGAAGAAGEKLVSLRVATDNVVGGLPILAGIGQGIFEKHGLTVTQEIAANITLIPAGLGKNYDIGESVGPIAISSANSGLPITVIAGEALVADSRLIASKNVSSPKDLEGKTVGAPTLAGNIHLSTLRYLSDQGVDISKVKFVQVPSPNMVDQLKSGLVDAVELQEPYLQIALDEGYVDLGRAMAEAVGKDTMTTFWIANKDWATANPEVVQKYNDALDESYAWIKDNQDDARALLQKFSGMSPELVSKVTLTQFQTKVPKNTMELWGKLMEEQGSFQPTIDYSDLIFKP